MIDVILKVMGSIFILIIAWVIYSMIVAIRHINQGFKQTNKED